MTTRLRVLITGGSTGIGFGLAKRYADRGAHVVITGRDQHRLAAVARSTSTGITSIAGDLSNAADRANLAAAVGPIDVLVNNAGIQRRVGLAEDTAPWSERQQELDLLLAAPMHLASLLVPSMVRRGTPATVVNVTSGGAFIPQPFAPGYSAAKAGLHSFTLNLRHALKDTAVRVVELIPPAVATGLSGLDKPHGADVDTFCDSALASIDAGLLEIGYGPTAATDFEAVLRDDRARFDRAAGRFPTIGY